MKLRILEKILYYWDVIFTLIDEWQLRKWLKLRKYIEEEKYSTPELMSVKSLKEIHETIPQDELATDWDEIR